MLKNVLKENYPLPKYWLPWPSNNVKKKIQIWCAKPAMQIWLKSLSLPIMSFILGENLKDSNITRKITLNVRLNAEVPVFIQENEIRAASSKKFVDDYLNT